MQRCPIPADRERQTRETPHRGGKDVKIMKKIISFIVCLTLIMAITVSAYAVMSVANGSAYLRRGPGTSYEAI